MLLVGTQLPLFSLRERLKGKVCTQVQAGADYKAFPLLFHNAAPSQIAVFIVFSVQLTLY